jgi:CHAD domain-containing protein
MLAAKHAECVMAFKFEPGESVGAETKRILVERLEAAIDHLAKPDVHDARKRLKEARAVLRLIVPKVGDEARAEITALRDIARLLAPTRDAEALVEAFQKIRMEIDPVLRRRLRRLLPKPTPIDPAPVIDALRASRDRINGWMLAEAGFELIEPGLIRTYARGRRASQAVAEDPTPELLHELRKRVKDAWYHHELLEDVWHPVIKGYEKALKELSDLLGLHHDLDLLRERFVIESKAGGIIEIIDQRRDQLRRDALRMAARLYAERKGEARRRWKAWLA